MEDPLGERVLAPTLVAPGIAPPVPLPPNVTALPRLFRTGSMLGTVLSDIDDTFDVAACTHAARLLDNGVSLIVESLGADLQAELGRFWLPLGADPSPAMLRVAYGQVCSWIGAVVTHEMGQLTTANGPGSATGGSPADPDTDSPATAQPVARPPAGYL